MANHEPIRVLLAGRWNRSTRGGAHAPCAGSRPRQSRGRCARDGVRLPTARGRRALSGRRGPELPTPAPDRSSWSEAPTRTRHRGRSRSAPGDHGGRWAPPYDLLLLALGARTVEAVPGAVTFTGPEEDGALRASWKTLSTGRSRASSSRCRPERVGRCRCTSSRSLRALTGRPRDDRRQGHPRHAGGEPARHLRAVDRGAVSELLEARGIELRLETTPLTFLGGSLELDPPAESTPTE